MREGDFFTRHSLKPKRGEAESSHEGISVEGERLAQERAAELLDIVEKSEKGIVLFLGGATDVARTKSTALVYGEEMKRIVKQRNLEDVEVILPDDLKLIEGLNDKVNYLSKIIINNPDKKFVIDLPLFIREFSFRDIWADGKGKWDEYGNELLKRNNFNDEHALKEWLANQGEMDGLEGPNPKTVAEKQLKGVERLRKFAEKYAAGRPLIIGSVGHCWNMDALAVYLANEGDVTLEAFEAMQAKMIGETEVIRMIDEDGKHILQYGSLKIPMKKE